MKLQWMIAVNSYFQENVRQNVCIICIHQQEAQLPNCLLQFIVQ